jgi:hypothetical protein
MTIQINGNMDAATAINRISSAMIRDFVHLFDKLVHSFTRYSITQL